MMTDGDSDSCSRTQYLITFDELEAVIKALQAKINRQ